MTPGQPLRIEIGRIRVSAASGLEARRLGDALPAAIERALSAMIEGTPPASGRPLGPADEAAARIAQTVGERLKAGR